MYPTRISAPPHRRVLLGISVLMSVVSAIVLMSGVVYAVLTPNHPALPMAREALAHYPASPPGDLFPHQQSVIKNPKAVLIFEGWASNDVQTVNQYFTDVSGSSLEGILSQYSGISTSITISKSVVDTSFVHSDLCGTSSISDSGFSPLPSTDPFHPADPTADMWYEIAKNAPIDSSTIYFVFAPPGYRVFGPADSCNHPTCGYHNQFPLGEGIYAVIPWGGGSCNNDATFPSNATDLDKTINTASHEQFEAITNPDPNSANGWYNSGGEIGDVCSNSKPGLYLNGHFYTGAQGEYNNATHDCVYTIPPAPTPTSPPLPTTVPITGYTPSPTNQCGAATDGYIAAQNFDGYFYPTNGSTFCRSAYWWTNVGVGNTCTIKAQIIWDQVYDPATDTNISYRASATVRYQMYDSNWNLIASSPLIDQGSVPPSTPRNPNNPASLVTIGMFSNVAHVGIRDDNGETGKWISAAVLQFINCVPLPPPPPTPTPVLPSGNLLINPGFEGYTGWCVWDNWAGGGTCNGAFDNSFIESKWPPHSGNSYRAHWSGSAWYDVTTYQAVTAPVSAYYSASLWVQTACNTPYTYFFLKNTNTGQEFGTIYIGTCYQGWTYFAINHIWFNQGDPVVFELHSVNNGPNMWVRFDDAYLCYSCSL